MKATKTEYQGIVFDSKSEAIFARVMTLAKCRWFYHPKPFNGHAWDFIVQPFPRFGAHEQCVGDSVYSYIQYTPQPLVFIEYKPRQPTATYVNNLKCSLSGSPVGGLIVYGDPFCEGDYKEILLNAGQSGITPVLPEFGCWIKEAMEYRFDLNYEREPQAICEYSRMQAIAYQEQKRAMCERLEQFAYEVGKGHQ